MQFPEWADVWNLLPGNFSAARVVNPLFLKWICRGSEWCRRRISGTANFFWQLFSETDNRMKKKYLVLFLLNKQNRHHEHQSDGLNIMVLHWWDLMYNCTFPVLIAHFSDGSPLYRNALKMPSRQVEEVHSCNRCDWKSLLGGGDCYKDSCSSPFHNDIRR